MMCYKALRIGIGLSLAVAATWLVGPRTQADSTGITFSGTLAGSGFGDASTWPTGPDYATDVLGNPWDFNNIDDVDRDPGTTQGWASFAVDTTGGVAGGTAASATYTSMGILYSGYYNALNPGRNGRRFPIDTTRYQKFAFQMTAGTATGAPQVYWFHLPWNHPSDPTLGHCGVTQLGGVVAGAKIYAADLQGGGGGDCPYTWTESPVLGLRLDRHAISTGESMSYDWVRLTVKNSDPSAGLQSITWTGGTASSVDVLTSNGTLNVAKSVSSVANWNYGVLPPGNYTLRVTLKGGGTLNRAFTINAPPMIQVLEPDETGAEDYSTAVLGNPWDMSDANDIQLTTPPSESITGLTFTNPAGQLTATNDGTTNGPNVMLLYVTNNSIPIDTSKYRYFTIRYLVDGAFDLGNGSVGRVLWSSQAFDGNTATTTRAFNVWTGMNTYTIDLGALTTTNDEGLEPTEGTPTQWTNGQKFYLNFHPHEFNLATPAPQQRTFHIDDIKLAAMDQTTSGLFTLKWGGSDANGGDPTVTLYYDTDTNPATKTAIVSGLATSAGSSGYRWNTSGVTPGTYWIYAEANDGVQTKGRYSTGQVRVLDPSSSPNPAMSIDAPTNGSTVIQPLTVSGYAVDTGASTGTGVDRVEVHVTPAGGTTTLLGTATLFIERTDVGVAFGSQFTNSGYSYSVTGLSPGTYTLTVQARSTVTGTLNPAHTVSVTMPTSNPLMAVDVPTDESTVGANFTLSGWALDQNAPSGVGVDYVDGYAYPIPSFNAAVDGDAIFLGRVNVGNARTDIGSALGSQFTNSGFSSRISALSPGTYRIYVYAHSLVSGTFNNFSDPIDVAVGSTASDPVMFIDQPADGATLAGGQPFTVSGWALDRGASSGSGIFDVHVWAFPVGAPQFFVWSAGSSGPGSLNQSRPDIGTTYGSQFVNSGYSFSVPAGRMPAGTYDLYVFTFCTLVGTSQPCQARYNRVTVQ